MDNQSVKNPVSELRYWINLADEELHCLKAKERVFQIFFNLWKAGMLRWYFLEDKKGVIVYSIVDDFRGGLTLNELFMYIKPEFRGSIKLFKELITHLEEAAKENNIDTVRIASNIGYSDSQVLKILQHWGYETDAVVKHLGEQ